MPINSPPLHHDEDCKDKASQKPIPILTLAESCVTKGKEKIWLQWFQLPSKVFIGAIIVIGLKAKPVKLESLHLSFLQCD